MSDLSGKTALVTGASRGIGRASALALARAGAQVLVHYSNSEKEAGDVIAGMRSVGGRAEKIGADLRQANGPHLLAMRVRAIVADDIARVVAFLASDNARWITGDIVKAGGGSRL
jgi:3-oxoacyl-[acyl-carrier protein] reductase